MLRAWTAGDGLRHSFNKHKINTSTKQIHIVHVVNSPDEKGSGCDPTPHDTPLDTQALKNARGTAESITVLKHQTAQRQAGRSVVQFVPMHQLSWL